MTKKYLSIFAILFGFAFIATTTADAGLIGCKKAMKGYKTAKKHYDQKVKDRNRYATPPRKEETLFYRDQWNFHNNYVKQYSTAMKFHRAKGREKCAFWNIRKKHFGL